MASLFPDPPRKFTWTKVPYSITSRPDCKPAFVKLLTTLAYLADDRDSVCMTREQIHQAAGIGRNAYLAAMRWLREIGAVSECPEPSSKAGKRIVLDFRHADFDARAGASQTPAKAPSPTRGGRARFRSASAPESGAPAHPNPARPSYRENSGEGERIVSSRISSDTVREAPEIREVGTGRDGFAAPAGEGTGAPIAPELAQAVEEREERAAAILARVGTPEALARRCHAAARMELAAIRRELAALRAGDITPIRPAPPRVLQPAPPPRAPDGKAGRPPRVVPDDAYPLSEAFRLCRALGGEQAGPQTADAFAAHLARRWRDDQAATLEHFRAAANLGTGLLETLIREAERPKVANPARYFSSRAGDALAANRRARRNRHQVDA